MISIWDSAIPLRRILPPELPKESGMPPPGPFFLLSGPIEPKRLLQAHKKNHWGNNARRNSGRARKPVSAVSAESTAAIENPTADDARHRTARLQGVIPASQTTAARPALLTNTE